MNIKRIAFSLLPIPFSALIAWVGGYNFDSRGFWPAYMLGICIVFCGFIYAYPGWNKKP